MKMTFTHHEIEQAIIALAKSRTILGGNGSQVFSGCTIMSAKGQRLSRITAEVIASIEESSGDFNPDKIPEKKA